MSQIETIFYKLQDIFEIHKEFYDALLPNIQQWDEKVTVGHLFQKLVSDVGLEITACGVFPLHHLEGACKCSYYFALSESPF